VNFIPVRFSMESPMVSISIVLLKPSREPCTVSKNVSKGVMKVLPFVVAVLGCVAGEMWHFFSGNELKKDRFRPSPPSLIRGVRRT
jgi:hypothetical protein